MKYYIILLCLAFSNLSFAQTNPQSPHNPTEFGFYSPAGHDGNGKVAKVATLNYDGTADALIIYNTDGKRASWYIKSGIVTYDYSADKKIVTINQGLMDEFYKYNYNADGKLSYRETYSNKFDVEERIDYGYNTKGQLIFIELKKRQQIRKNQYGLKRKEITTYEYDNKGRVIKKDFKGYVTNFDYDQKGDELTVTVSSAGKPIQTYRYDKYGALLEYQDLAYAKASTLYDYQRDKLGNIVYRKSNRVNEGKVSETGYIIQYADGKVSQPEEEKLTPVFPNQANKVYATLRAPFQTGNGFVDKGKLNGPGMLVFLGNKYEGNFMKGEQTGFGIASTILDPGVQWMGEYKKGKLNGYGIKTSGNTILEAGIYSNGLLKTDLTKDYKSAKTSINCTGNCSDGFGKRTTDLGDDYTFFKNGKAFGPYIVTSGGTVERGFMDESQHFIYSRTKTLSKFGFVYNKNGDAKIAITDGKLRAGICENGKITEEYPIISK